MILFDPMVVPPGTESWAERYGAIGVVAFLAISALTLALRQFFTDHREDRARQTRESEDHDKRVALLNDRLVEAVGEGHRKTLELLAQQQAAHEQRYQQLLERHIEETSDHVTALRAQSAATVEALQAVVRKLSPRGQE